MELLHIIKIGGNIIDDASKLDSFIAKFSQIKGLKILVHGGGKLATNLAEKLHVEQKIIDGRRVTCHETLKITTMVYAGLVNKNIVAKLQANTCNSIGLSGMDGNCILSKKRTHSTIDYGWVGDIESINVPFFQQILQQGLVPVISPITADTKGHLFNTNADTIATQLAIALAKSYTIKLRYCFEKLGVLTNPDDDSSWIKQLDKTSYSKLVNDNTISKGMLPKLENAFNASASHVNTVEICHADYVAEENINFIGTQII